MFAILSFCFCFIFFISSVSCGLSTLASPSYIVLIDAGSSGSRIHIHKYYWIPDELLPVIEPSEAKKITPGISSFNLSPQSATGHIELLIEFAKEKIPESEWSLTPIHLQATAGLRSIKHEKAEEILAVSRNALANTGFLFEPEWALIISGEQEGINGWIATNYLLGSFSDSATSESDTPAIAASSTHGVVEMGGSSMQITFVPLNPSESHRKRLYSISIAGRSYSVYTHSFLQYGLQAAEKLFQSLTINEIEENGNPCYPTGLKHSATGNFASCVKLMKKLVDKSKLCDFDSCSFNGIYQPTIQMEPFLAIENFFYTAKFFGHVDESQGDIKGNVERGALLMKAVSKAGAEYCELSWDEINARHGDKSEKSKLAYFCFAAAYESAVLQDGFGFTENSNIRPAKTIKDKSIDWELGAALLQILNNQKYTDIVRTHGQSIHHSLSTPDELKSIMIPHSPLIRPSLVEFDVSNSVYFYFFGLLFSTVSGVWIYTKLKKPGNYNGQQWNSMAFHNQNNNQNWNKV